MKILTAAYNTDVLIVDTDNADIQPIKSQRNACNRVYIVPEDMHFKYVGVDSSEEFDVKAGDILIAFWDEDFPHKYVKVTSKEWKENLDNYNRIQNEYEEKCKNCGDKSCKCL